MNKKETLLVQQLTINVEYKKMKNVYLKIKPDGKILISAPVGTSRTYLIQFVNSRLQWIKDKQAVIDEKQSLSKSLTDTQFLLFGQVSDNTLTATQKHLLLQEKINGFTEKHWHFFAEKGCKKIQIKYRKMTATWGICRPTIHTITYNKALLHQPLEFIEYVVVHELCHLLVPNHSRQFWQLVAYFLPNYKTLEKLAIKT